ncbi:MAG: pilus assembly protein PilN [Oceanospirillaceae bacterium]|mgnify:CR=1 FL=1|uniref:PilN domain-containing protein n=1 Tax=unclassified Thalassolituus TaxID=2624967 RepID=UPI000C44DF8C|nr:MULTISPECIES: PilN domain-containing protein [unclassified Thalassolituus]MAS23722.1 pilus assembly protein PilN [Oceanospirillaceae bacterium]MAY00397.1 pilus assembly protein PilN [Oceanospirillaceae bacterium]MBL34007.1 pilus assembly protein PilN [Oceanospirillaceae bacterium]MBS52011.1 pilus assembly protein PilN [Oceanospirillaceae bacterium]|tara:strand:+ start:255 stop:812 length:558 start_codon:yes stop_codon:yes gene_type:complete
MAKINLLPWREERRKERQNEFYGVIVFVLLVAGGIIFAVNSQIESSISNQKVRNDYLTREGKVLDTKIDEIRELKDTRQKLIERMKLIQDLQGNRPVIVRVFDEVVRAVPEDLYLTDLSIKGNSVQIKGRARSNNRVSGFMRNFDASDWFADPTLIRVQSMDDGFNVFEISMKRVQPRAEEAGEG